MAERVDKLITFAYLKNEVDVPQNIDGAEFDAKIYQAQETLRMIMGDEFYQDFKAAYKAGPMSAVYNSLYEYVKQAVAWQAYEFWVVSANFKATRSGFRVHSEDNSTAATDVQMAILIKDAKQKSQYYKKLLIGFMDNHSADYPLYEGNCHNSSTGNTSRISAAKGKKHDGGCKCRICR